jgi:hypothetical protein
MVTPASGAFPCCRESLAGPLGEILCRHAESHAIPVALLEVVADDLLDLGQAVSGLRFEP